MSTKCPSCAEVITGFTVREVPGCGYGGRSWKCISMNCPKCNTSLGVQVNPDAIKKDLLADMAETVR